MKAKFAAVIIILALLTLVIFQRLALIHKARAIQDQTQKKEIPKGVCMRGGVCT